MLFSYKAKTQTGQVIEDLMSATNRFALARELRSRGIVPISIQEKKKGLIDNILALNFLNKVSTAELMIFSKNLSGMLKAGLALSRAISVLQKQTKKPLMSKILASLNTEINAGGTLSSGLTKFPETFSQLFISMTRAGEESGDLSGALEEVSSNLEKSHALTKKVHGALIYPGVILSAMVVIGVLMFAFVVPTLALTFEELGVDLPTSTRFIIGTGNFFSDHLLTSLGIIFLFVFGIFSLVRAKFMAKYVDFAILKIPVLGTMAKQLNTARTARSISSLLRSGISIVRAVEITGDVVQNIYYRRVLEEAKAGVEKGSTFSAVFEEHTDLYPVMMTEMVQVGEETGKLSEMLLQIAIFYENEIENKTKNLSTIIEPFLMVIIGAGVGFFAISMISPLYSVLQNIE